MLEVMKKCVAVGSSMCFVVVVIVNGSSISVVDICWTI